MTWQIGLTALTILGMFVALVRGRASPELILLTALALLCGVGIVTPTQAVAGFGNEGLVTVAMMFVLVTGLSQTGAMARLVAPFLGQPRTETGARLRLVAPVATFSAFMNNTPLVAMFMPVVDDWSRRTGIPKSKLFMPLSFAAILGGTCTLVGTSTNLVVQGLLLAEPGTRGLGMLELAWVGVPCALVGLTWCVFAGRWLLPDRRSALAVDSDPREYTVELRVEPGSPLVGTSIEAAGLRHLQGLFLAEIERNGHILAAVAPTERLEANDRLVFVGVVDSVKELRRIRGLVPIVGTTPPSAQPEERCLVEAVVSDASPMIGQTVRESRFRSQYNAVIVAVARNGERIRRTKIGDIVLRPGDTLLLDARPDFLAQHRNSRVFYLVSEVAGSAPLRHERAGVAVAILVAVVLLSSLGVMTMLQAALLGAVAMLLTGCCTVDEARRSLDLTVLVVIGAAFGLGQAIEASGLGSLVAEGLVGTVGTTPLRALAATYGLTMLFNAFISNNAAVALMFPIAAATASSLGVELLPFAVALMMAGSNDFATPIGYQTNLMVYGPGGYRFGDYLRFGGPLNLLMFALGMVLIPVFWPF